MPSLRGSLVRVTASPSTAVGVLVRAPAVRAWADGVVLTEETQVPIDRGEFTVELELGPAVLTVQHAGYPGEVIPLLVVEGQSTIAEAVQAAAIADGAEKSEIASLLAEVKALVDSIAAHSDRAVGAERTAKAAAKQARISAGVNPKLIVSLAQQAASAMAMAVASRADAEDARAVAVEATRAAQQAQELAAEAMKAAKQNN